MHHDSRRDLSLLCADRNITERVPTEYRFQMVAHDIEKVSMLD